MMEMPRKSKNNGDPKSKEELITEEQQILEIIKKADAVIKEMKEANVPVKRGFSIPAKFLNQLNEFTNGGFILFTFDESGSPKVYSQFDSDTHALGLFAFLNFYANSMNEIHQNTVTGTIIDPNMGEDEDGPGSDKPA